jgi:hypothetical protein
MTAFAAAWPDGTYVQQAVAQMPRSPASASHDTLLDVLRDEIRRPHEERARSDDAPSQRMQ